ncbi:MAG TPA: phytoene desaturase [Candidatus Methylacidiphilales bacterium]|nr:phytoene desaturase [Candidatus Methylacidiphilales bacterium]
MTTLPSREAPTALVIGSGFGGLGAAIRLQARGYDTTILEMRDKPGGRAYVFKDKGFTYDAGPTIITAPFLIDELFALAGKKTEDYVKIVPVTPYYRIVFHDGQVFDYTGVEAEIVGQIKKFNPDDVAGYLQFAEKSRAIFDRAFTDLADQPFSSFADMARVAPDLIRLRSHESVFRLVSRYVKHPLLRQVFSFHPLLIGGNPFQSSSIYAMIHYLERQWGVHFAMGGTGALVQALVRLFTEMGGKIRLNARVEELLVENGSACGVRLASGEKLDATVVVSNADVAHFYKKAVPATARKKWTDARLDRMRYSMSLFLIYFGTDRTYPDLAHHTIVLTERYQELLEDIFNKKILAGDFSLYLHAPTRTDTSLAPPGCECFYVLSPVPHLGGKIDWESVKERYAEVILASLEKLCPDLRRHIISKIIWTPRDFETRLDAHLGSAFQFEPILTQSAWFRPHNVSEDVKNFFLVGAGTHPGAGVPGVLSSAKLLERVLPVF